MPKALWELKDILRAGGSVEVDARNLATWELKDLARVATEGGGMLIVNNADVKATWELKDIARAGRGRVIFRGLR